MDPKAEFLFKQAHKLLAQAGYSHGRVRRLRKPGSNSSLGIRAPGPSTPQPELPADFSFESEPYTRSPPAFRKARYIRLQSKTPRPLGSIQRETPRIEEQNIDTKDRRELQGLFRQLKAQEKLKVDQRLKVFFERKEKLGIFDSKTNLTRKNTSAHYALSYRC